MNPLSLLTKGNTFKSITERPGAYKLLANSGLPRFTANKRTAPELSPSAPQEGQASLFEQPAAAAKATLVDTPKAAAPAVEPVKRPNPFVSPRPTAQPVKPIGRPCASDTWKQAVALGKDLVRRFLFGRKRRLVHGPTVQTELALEKETEMRNNLDEDDLEVVLVERKVGTGEKPLARLSKMEMTGEAWIRLTAPFRKKNSDSAFDSKAEAKPSPELSARV